MVHHGSSRISWAAKFFFLEQLKMRMLSFQSWTMWFDACLVTSIFFLIEATCPEGLRLQLNGPVNPSWFKEKRNSKRFLTHKSNGVRYGMVICWSVDSDNRTSASNAVYPGSILELVYLEDINKLLFADFRKAVSSKSGDVDEDSQGLLLLFCLSEKDYFEMWNR